MEYTYAKGSAIIFSQRSNVYNTMGILCSHYHGCNNLLEKFLLKANTISK